MRAGQAAPDLRGLPAGRRRHLAQVRRHRPGPGDQPRAGRAAGRRDQAAPACTARAAPSRSTCRCTTSGADAPTLDAQRQAGRRRRAGASRCRWRARSTSPTTATSISPGDPVLLIDRGRPALRAHPARAGARQGLQGPGRHQGRAWRCRWRASTSPTAISLDIFLPDMLGWTVLNQLKLDPAHAPHPGADHHAGGGAPARPVARRLLLPGQGADHRGPGSGLRPHQGLHRAAHQAAAGGRGQRHRARRPIVELLGHDDIEIVTVGTGDEALAALRDAAVRLRGAGPAPARHDRLRAAGAAAGRARRWPTCRSSSSPART